MPTHPRVLAALCCTALLVAAACGAQPGRDANRTTAAVSTETTAVSTTAPATTAPTSIAPVIASSTTSDRPSTTTTSWGVDTARHLIGPAGMDVDLSACPATWSDSTGISADRIVIGQTAPLTGAIEPVFSPMLAAYDAYIAQLNAEGGINGRQIEIRREDDQYQPAQTADAARRLIDQGVFALANGVNSEQAMGAASVANEACVPQLFAYGAHPGLADPAGRPWTTGLGPSLDVEAEILLTHIAATYSGGARIALVTVDNYLGWAFEGSVPAAIAARPGLQFLGTFRHTLSGADAAERTNAALATDPDVIILATAGFGCANAINAIAASGSTATRYSSSGCSHGAVVDTGHSDDWFKISTLSYPEGLDRAVAPDLVRYRTAMTNVGIDPTDFQAWNAFFGAHTLIQTLRRADALPGGLTRANALLAARALQLSHPALPQGVNLRLNGNSDGHAVEGATLIRFAAGRDIPVSTYDLDGEVRPCHWDLALAVCA